MIALQGFDPPQGAKIRRMGSLKPSTIVRPACSSSPQSSHLQYLIVIDSWLWINSWYTHLDAYQLGKFCLCNRDILISIIKSKILRRLCMLQNCFQIRGTTPSNNIQPQRLGLDSRIHEKWANQEECLKVKRLFADKGLAEDPLLTGVTPPTSSNQM